jgi:tetratricopeptide (TPR) repeat protein
MNRADLTQSKAQARAWLQAGQLGEAFAALQALARQNPGDAEVWLWLGDCFMANGELDHAARCYQRVATLAPEHADLRARQLWLGQQAAPTDSAPSQAEDLASLRQALGTLDQSLAFVSAADLARASTLLREIVTHPDPAELISERLDEVDQLLPALITLNIRQAHQDGAPAVVEALEQLLVHLHLTAEPAPAPERAAYVADAPARPRVLAITAGRQALVPADILRQRGIDLVEARHLSAEEALSFDAIIVSDPHADPDQMPVLAAAVRHGTPLVVGVSADHVRLPAEHPDFHRLSLTTPERLDAFVTALQLADVLIVPSDALAGPLRDAGHTVRVLAPTWRRADGWDLPRPRRTATHVGWIADPGTHQDVLSIRPELQRAALSSGAILVFAGDPLAYQAFTLGIPAAQRAYLPPVSDGDLPHIYAQMDVLVAPQRPTEFAAHSSDRRLVEASARGVVWVASPTPAAVAWGAGGLIARTPEAWDQQLTRLLGDTRLRQRLADEGRAAALARELEAQSQAWLNVIENVMDRSLPSARGPERPDDRLAVPYPWHGQSVAWSFGPPGARIPGAA